MLICTTQLFKTISQPVAVFFRENWIDKESMTFFNSFLSFEKTIIFSKKYFIQLLLAWHQPIQRAGASLPPFYGTPLGYTSDWGINATTTAARETYMSDYVQV